MASKKTAAKPRAVREQPPVYSVQRAAVYVESSAVVAAILENDADVQRILRGQTRIVTSSLTFAECWRAFVRARVSGRLTEEGEAQARQVLRTLLHECVTVPMTDDVLERAGRPFPIEPVRTLDAVHLASIEWLALPTEDVLVVTRDRRVRENAFALGYTVV